MAKKTFAGGLNSLLESSNTAKSNRGRPTTRTKEITKSSQENTRPDETRATFIVKEALLEKLKGIAYWERAMIKDIINTAIEDAVNKYEKKNGPVKKIPKK